MTGFSGEAIPGACLNDLCTNVRPNQIGQTTVGEVRAAGGDVIITEGDVSPTHVTVTNIDPEAASELLSPSVKNPVPKAEWEVTKRDAEKKIEENMTIRIYGDFNNADREGNIRLHLPGSKMDIEKQGLELKDGMEVIISDGELEVLGYTKYSKREKIWVACIKWNEIKDI